MSRLFMLSLAAATVLGGSALLAQRAEAAPISAPGAATAIQEEKLAQDAAYICQRRWRCGPYGYCGWRRVCFWEPGPYAYYGYGRPYWRHRHWRHW